MIRHIVFFTVKRAEDLETVQRLLGRLGEIPHALAFEVAANARIDPIGDAADIVVYGEFADEAGLAAWKAHPIYDETTKAVRPLRELRWSADFRSTVR
ncbi:Stress responsive A/B Barrel Domain [Bosea sp. 62]|uniref:Dabb family protein n=1 Tax=unclassified Bosea (in: a-proteobacteria) TaxID=2653178 RepID=UPI00125A8C79|nr:MULTISPECIES: Dabb family protein [unclassified Bosea (in: a-proteobacteria)]CAD5288385.1 Stress responsive A/B Barrel Domain [Bosea sp. 7B]CAD5300402.1 Stress responsive A/B Barrel Domain [Bosea sp. 21B]CAD5301048.1 Stress responsive A/B Barrel Domain [Bosea sp. 46]VVT62106.1 Stress responsive A/B Barrel Domain [Bosea sp. EC-HK365B]VXB63413.1 Stress responsive A/B Barrel Domain [Bosea sp. 125]